MGRIINSGLVVSKEINYSNNRNTKVLTYTNYFSVGTGLAIWS